MPLSVQTTTEPRTPPKGHVQIVGRVSPGTTEQFLALYRAAFEPLTTRSPARQWLTDDEFRQDMEDDAVKKFVAFDASGEIIALALMSTDLATVPWISAPYFEAKYPDHHARGALFYFGAMLVRPDRQGGPWATYLLDHIFHYLAERRGMAAFDCCGFNVDTTALPQLVARAGRRLIHMDLTLLDRQEYYAAVVEGFK